MEKQNPKFNETDVYRVRRDSRLNQGLFLCKLIIKKHGTVQIQGMGASISMVSKIGQILSKNGLASMKSIRSENVQRDNNKHINPKLIIRLEKSANFDKLTENIVLRS